MRTRWIAHLFGLVLLVVIVIAAFGQAVLQLWNWLMPSLFSLPQLTFWQAVGLLALSWILFGGWRGFPRHGGYWRHRMRERWEHMTPEQREEFRKAMRHRCGHRGEASSTEPAKSE